ncbi:2Fe-2S iron-sulfur cluster binding domain-containing protein [Vineibacter terrae]|uniref:2Fe-2S iron-sulfur cluster binding domain-containing protein n=1 Tax=Vineibacter terrae TaxID=2586908 RepID=A0A5C8PAH1_9HYPH|nr:2Fe-2S iron-sulfur cluster-binding protein [Vineibacter terrae]TXL70243.1 2Fe-2S iron-sulfur cluster binding domain-containing protein [Vineibacter terrae]
MPHAIVITNTGETFGCGGEESVLAAMERLRRKGIPVGCRNGGCGVCKVEVVDGQFTKRKMSRAVVSMEEEARGCVLACKVYPQGDLRITVVGKMVRAIEAQQGMASFALGFAATTASQPDTES